MKKCKIFNQSDQEVATILLWSADNHKVGIVLIDPYIVTVFKEGYLTDTSDDYIITDLLNKANLFDVKIKYN